MIKIIVTDSKSRGFPEWDNLYMSQQVENIPWYNEKLDSDLEEEISEQKNLCKGRFLDLGTGPATQAVQIARKGYTVTDSDISQAAIRRAQEVYGSEENVNLAVDNVFHSNFKEDEFDYIFDRGCFHVLDPSDRHDAYSQTLREQQEQESEIETLKEKQE